MSHFWSSSSIFATGYGIETESYLHMFVITVSFQHYHAFPAELVWALVVVSGTDVSIDRLKVLTGLQIE